MGFLYTVNETKVRNLHHTRELIDSCSSEYLHFGLSNNLCLVLKTEAARKATQEVLEKEGIPAEMSPDLAGTSDASAAAGTAEQASKKKDGAEAEDSDESGGR